MPKISVRDSFVKPAWSKKKVKDPKNSRGTHEGAKRVIFRRGKRENI